MAELITAGDGAAGAALATSGDAVFAVANYRGGLKAGPAGDGVVVHRLGGWSQTIPQGDGESVRGVAAAASTDSVFVATVASKGQRGPHARIHAFDAASGKPRWTYELHSSSYAVVRGLAASADGAVFAVGAFAGVVEIADTALRSDGLQDGLIIALDRNGAPSWGQRFGGVGGDYAAAVAWDSKLGLAVAGAFTGEAAVGRATARSQDDSFDVVLLRLRADGGLLWVKTLGGTGTDTPIGVAMANGRIAVAAGFEDAMMVAGQPVSAAGAADIVVSAWNADGSAAWSQIVGSEELDLGAGLAASADGFALAGELGAAATIGDAHAAAGSFVAHLRVSDGRPQLRPLPGVAVSSIAGQPGGAAAIAGTANGKVQAGGKTLQAPPTGAAAFIVAP